MNYIPHALDLILLLLQFKMIYGFWNSHIRLLTNIDLVVDKISNENIDSLIQKIFLVCPLFALF